MRLPFELLYPFQNETMILNRVGSLFLYVTTAIWKGIRSRFYSRRLFQFLWIGVIKISSLRNGSPHRGLYFGTGIA